MNLTHESEELRKLLATFMVEDLGEGDTDAGANLLAGIAVTLANLAPTGSSIEDDRLGRLRAGASILVIGGASSSLLREKVIEETAVRQNMLTSHIERMFGDAIADAKKEGLKVIKVASDQKDSSGSHALQQLFDEEAITYSDFSGQWREVLNFPPTPRIDDLARAPKFFVTARGAGDLEKQLRHLNGYRPLVALGLNRPSDASTLATTCEALLTGPYPTGLAGETVSCHLIVTDPCNVVAEIAPHADDKARWLGRMVWLVDNCDPEGFPHANETPVQREPMLARFGEAICDVLAKRLNPQGVGPVVHRVHMADAQVRFVAYLREMEPQLPGITGTARSLLATLTFGLNQLANAPKCERLPVSLAGVEAFAKLIIRRMARTRVTMMHTADRERLLNLALRFLCMLEQGPQTERDLYRSTGVQANLCRKVLHEVQAAGVIQQIGNRWERSKPGPVVEADIQQLFLPS